MMIFLTIFSLTTLLVQIEKPMEKIEPSRKTIDSKPSPGVFASYEYVKIFKAHCMYEPINMRTSNPTDSVF
jgi:hypothetical protein